MRKSLQLVGCLVGCLLLSQGGLAVSAGDEPKISEGSTLNVEQGRKIYQSACSGCHDAGKSGAPRLADQKAWANRSYQWFSVLKDHASKGFLKMPPQGQRSDVTDEDISAAVFFMLEEVRERQP